MLVLQLPSDVMIDPKYLKCVAFFTCSPPVSMVMSDGCNDMLFVFLTFNFNSLFMPASFTLFKMCSGCSAFPVSNAVSSTFHQ